MAKLSPMMEQYTEIKGRYKDSILFFRLGDFYETFYDDAKIASEELDLTLTGKDCGQEERAPMCGVPFHSCDGYIARLVERGYKVAICEQVENPAEAKGIVKRDVVKIITPGTVLEDSMLDESKNNYLCAVSFNKESYGLCFADASTGEIHVTGISGNDAAHRVTDEIGRFSPREILTGDDINKSEIGEFISNRLNGIVTVRGADSFDPAKTEPLLLQYFDMTDIKKIGIQNGSVESAALGAAVEYLLENGVTGQLSINKIDCYTQSQYMRLDLSAIRNLEIEETMYLKAKRGSLLWAIDKTKTAMGKRLIRSWLEKPLMNIAEITLRQNAVCELVNNSFMCGEITAAMSGVKDIERLITKIVYGTASPKDLLSIKQTVYSLPNIKELLSGANCRLLKQIYNDIDVLADIKMLIENAIDDEAPFSVRDGGIIKTGYNEEVDKLKNAAKNGAGLIAELEAREKERTGIKNLRIRYNKVFGYFIEVTNSMLDKVPSDYIRKQTLTNCERYINDELKKIESYVLGSKERLVSLEYDIFYNVLGETAKNVKRFRKTASAISVLDVLCSLATAAVENNYCCPKLNDEGIIQITGGRHPVVEKVIKTPFVSNDTYLDNNDNRCAIITGPNMAGKSTYMRQVAIISVMAQIGSFVPAESANLCVVDAVFTRVGASDDLSSGQSTFMLEMNEVANIIKNATKDSLLILDEIGRGTSTFDGMSIAKAVLEYVVNKRTMGAKTLFATHYHELTEMENEISGVKNYNIAVKKRGDDIIFLRRIVKGGADNSYGIEVAKLAGIPSAVTNRAKVILEDLLTNGITYVQSEKTVTDNRIPVETIGAADIYNELKELDVNTLTPIESMKMLYDLSAKAKSL